MEGKALLDRLSKTLPDTVGECHVLIEECHVSMGEIFSAIKTLSTRLESLATEVTAFKNVN